MAGALKDDQNTPIDDINTITNPNTKTLIDRYVFASNFCKDKTVLDCACGHGYGSIILAALGAKWVTGYDIDKDAIISANAKYAHPGDNQFAGFVEMDATKKWDDELKEFFDVVVSIETFEHVPRETVPQMLRNFKYACKPGGTIIITTPQRHSPTWEYPGGTHLYEYTLNEFVEELGAVFSNIKLYFAVEFNHPASQELNTVFTDDPSWAKYAPVMIAVIKNE